MKKVMVHAVTKLNLGDDLFLKILFERYPNTNFIISAHNMYKKYYAIYDNTSVHSSSNIVSRGINFFMRKFGQHVFIQKSIAKKCDISIHIGGSIFQQKVNWKSQLKNRKSLLIENQPFYILGANFGSYTESKFYEGYFNLFKKYADICFRDDYSYNLFSKLSNVRKAADIVFSLNYDAPLTDDKKVVISVIKPSFRPYLMNRDHEYYEKIKEISINYIKDGFDVVLMSFCKAEGDEEAIKEIANMIPERYEESIKVHKYYGDINSALKEISSASAVIATRFHAMILGWLYEKPTFPIAYNDKMFNVMEDVGYEGKYIGFDNLDRLTFEDYRIRNDMYITNISKQVKNSEEHFNVLDKFIK